MPDDLIIKPLNKLQNQYLLMVEKNLILQMNDQIGAEAEYRQIYVWEHDIGLKETLTGETNGNK